MKYLLNVFLTLILLSACNKRIALVSHTNLQFESIEEILIHSSDVSIGPCEPSISINRFNDNQVIAGSVLDNLYRSEDGGRTWSIGKINSTHGVFGDPVLRRDKLGNPLYAHLSNSKHKPYASTEFLDRIVVQRSLDQGKNWTNGSYPLVDHQKDHDKHWLYTDPITGAILMSWTEFDVYGSKLPRDKSRILFSQSTDNGITWSNAVSISEFEGDCIDDDKTTEGAHPCVGIDGTYYVVWSFGEKLYLDISKDKGISWLSKDIVVSDQPQGWSYNIPGISRCNGMPVMACDHSDGPYKGRLFISWSDQRNGEHNTDIWIMSSDDKGKTWSKPLRVNNDITETHQFMSWMDIDHVTGNIYIVFYDRRNHKNNSTDVYMAYSQDGGRRFENVKINNKEFTPTESVFFGDYNDISAHNGKIRPIWTTYESGKLSVRTAIINVRK